MDNLYTRLGELPDDVFVIATESIHAIAESLKEATGEAPSIALLCDVLLAGIQGCAGDVLSDVPPHAVVELKPKVVGKAKKKVQPGDVVAIPDGKGGWTLGQFLHSNRFGVALGLFDGHHQVPRLPKVPKVRVAIYTDDRALLSGRWKVVDHRPDLLKHFPAELEIYFPKEQYTREAMVGEFGAAENVAGKVRQLKPGEGKSFGFVGPKYHSSYMCEELERLLNNERL